MTFAIGSDKEKPQNALRKKIKVLDLVRQRPQNYMLRLLGPTVRVDALV